jgi:hypothetical protein
MADKPSKPQEGQQQQQKPSEIQADPRLAHTSQKSLDSDKVEKR